MRYGLPRSPSPSPVRRYVTVMPRRAILTNTSDLLADALLSVFHQTPRAISRRHQQIQTQNYHPPAPSRPTHSATSLNQKFHSLLRACIHVPFSFHALIIPFNSRPKREPRSPAEQRHVEDTVAAIRLRTRHHDPYEEWEKQTRKDAFVRYMLPL
jgi:hypothetical protein